MHTHTCSHTHISSPVNSLPLHRKKRERDKGGREGSTQQLILQAHSSVRRREGELAEREGPARPPDLSFDILKRSVLSSPTLSQRQREDIEKAVDRGVEKGWKKTRGQRRRREKKWDKTH